MAGPNKPNQAFDSEPGTVSASAGTSGNTAALSDFLDAKILLGTSKVSGKLLCVLHPKQWGDIVKDAALASGGAIQLTGDPRRWPAEPAMPGIVKFWGPYTYRSAFHSADDAEETQRALAHLEDVIMVEGPQFVAAVILETVVGTNGILVPPPGYLQGVRDICDRHGIVMILDEVMSGMGRTGTLHAGEQEGISPDIEVIAKGLGGGYQPIGGILVHGRVIEALRRELAGHLQGVAQHGTTADLMQDFGGLGLHAGALARGHDNNVQRHKKIAASSGKPRLSLPGPGPPRGHPSG